MVEPVVELTATDIWQVSIIGPTGKPVGGGVLVPPRYVLTCAHVVTTALGRRLESEPNATVTITLTSGLELKGSPGGGHRYTGGTHHEDFAVLTLHGDLTQANGQFPASHTHLAGGTYAARRPMQVYGYPQGQPHGVWADCLMAGRGGLESALIQLNDAPDTGRKVAKGYSGCGVKDATTERVAGLAVLRDKSPEAGVTWMIPMAQLAQSWPPLRAALALSGERLPSQPASRIPSGPDDGPFDPEAMDDLYRLLLDGRILLPGLVALRDEALGPVRRPWQGAPEDVLGIVHDLQNIAQAGRPVPPLLAFVAMLSRRVPGTRGQELARWVRGRAGHCVPVVDPTPLLERRTRPATAAARWTYATFQITPATPSRHYLLDVFRQYEGEPREAVQQYTEAMRLGRVERLVIDEITRMRRERAINSPDLFVEFVLPRELLARPVDGLPIATPSGAEVRLGVVHPVAIRSLERQNASEWVDWGHNWSQKWDKMKALTALSGEGVVDVIPARSQDRTQYESLFAALYAEDGPVVLILGFPPKVPGRRVSDAEFDAALDAGIPALVWAHDEADGRRVIEGLHARLRNENAYTLPEVVRRVRRGERSPGPGASRPPAGGGRRLGFLWDPFDRLPPHTPLAPPAPALGGDQS
ncbi:MULTISPECIES: trypsin-like serine protease [unclassified Streptomyces]|uniref:VMAP-C domain-containing protein n=1 Tax=unclassified Streptomyces TaxID=2593676 RepID=UPI0036583E02